MFSNILSIDNIAFTLLNYQMSYVELVGTIFTATSVYLAAKNKIISWPIGLVGVVLFMFLFFQIQLYADLLEQIYYLITGFWGWWLWSHPKNTDKKDGNNELRISLNSKNETLISWLVIIVGTILLGYFISRLDLIFPAIFIESASYPYIDTFTTVLSFVANYLLMKRKLDCWYMWIIVDVIGVWLYYVKGTPLLSLLYFGFLINAVIGQIKWSKTFKSYEKI